MSINAQEARDAGFKVEPMAPPPPDYKRILNDMYHILRGTQVALDNRMVPDATRELVLKGCLDGQIDYLAGAIAPQENQIEVIMQAIEIQRAVLVRT